MDWTLWIYLILMLFIIKDASTRIVKSTPTPNKPLITSISPSTTVKSSPKNSCGVPKIPYVRIIGGANATKGSWPWQVGLVYKGILYCGGTIINPTTILTAAHCVEYMAPESISIKVGAHDLTDPSNEQLFNITTYKMHEGYDPKDYPNDIAIVKLKGAIKFGTYVQPVCLPRAKHTIPVGATCYTTGWGYTTPAEDQRPQTLQQLKVNIINNTECQRKNGVFATVTKDMVCAVKYDHTDASTNRLICGGDSGGPLVCLDKHQRWKLHGVVNWAAPICDSQYSYSVFARMTHHRHWIDQNI
uniref:Peptidase S1 domain-containing protein n=1 Tax=Clytia hemisphaerica TaxID=252671 RepID=A0A7M5X8U7_9CNID